MKSVRELKDIENTPVLLRTSQAVNEVRIREALPTIELLRKRNARVILATHVSGNGTETSKSMYEALRKFIPSLQWCPVPVGAEAHAMVQGLVPGEVLMLENLRRNPGEEKNDPEFAKELASLADVFVEDAFDVCHRKHASIVSVPKLLKSYAGLTVEKEVEELTKALKPKSPSLAIIAGAKFSTKEPVLTALLKTYDHVYVGGALANDFLKAKGYDVGKSLVSDESQDHIRELLKNPKLVMPVDAYVASPGAHRDAARVADAASVGPNEAVLDAGPKTAALLAELAGQAKTITWNGPLGLFEDGFNDSTRAVALAVAQSKAHSIVGGGDTLSAIEALGLGNEFSFVSTGGGAMLDFLAYGTLPGIEALR